MFYSHTFLARKGPLSTVWIAAHLQHRLRKSHYTATDIPSTVLRIMDPGVPIALRMSGHLLLGVVRIYSKKVEYLHQDCKDVMTGLHKTFVMIHSTHSEEARPAPFQSVTLPGTFDLDAQNLDDEIDHNRCEDRHLRNVEDITLTDRVLVTMDGYVAVSFDEDIMIDSAHKEVLPDSGAIPMEGHIPQSPSVNVVGAEDQGPSTQTESPTIQATLTESDRDANNDYNLENPSIQAEPIEILRDANTDYNLENPLTQPDSYEFRRDADNDHNVKSPQVFSNPKDNDAEQNTVLDQTTNEMIPDLDPEGMSVPSHQHFNPPTPPTSQGGTSGAQAHHNVSENNSPNLVLRESPLRLQPQRRGRKRKQFFDDPTVLMNKFMSKALKNPNDILRKRRDVPSSSLGTWKLNNSRRKEHIFDQPLLSGVGQDLLDLSSSEFVRSRPHLIISEEDHVDARMAETLSPTNQSPEEPIAAANQTAEEPIAAANQTAEEPIAATNQTSEDPIAAINQTFEEPIAATSSVTAFDMEIEHGRNVAVSPPPTVAEHIMVDTSPVTASNMEIEHGCNVAVTPPTIPEHNVVEGDRSPDRRDDFTTGSPRSASVASLRTNIASERMHTVGLSASPGTHRLGTMQTPDSDTQHFNSATTDEFWFLRLDSNTPASSLGTSGSNRTLSERTKHAAEYLRRVSPITPILEDPDEMSEHLSLNKILEGKTRHIAARMFFEVLVLKTNRLVDVQQEEPYGDVSLKLDPTLSNAQS